MSIGEQGTEKTVGSIMDRLYLQVLSPPDDQFAQVSLAADIDEVSTTVRLGGFTVPEDESLMRLGVLIEFGQELVRVVSYDGNALVAEVTRGEYGTPVTAHTAPSLGLLNTPFPRATVFETVADNLITLSPKLYTVDNELLSPTTQNVYSISDPLAVEVLTVTPGDFTRTEELHGEIVDFHPMTGGRALIANGASGSVWLRYRKRMDKATSEDDILSRLGVDERWANIVIAGAAADLLVGKDLPASRTEWVRSVLEAENIRVGSRMSIAGGLRQYRDMLLTDAEAEMKVEYRTKVRMRSTMRQIV